MAGITAAQVKELRDQTGVGMMDCKRALVETDGDLEKAKDWLRAKGIARAADKAGRVASEGVVEAYVHSGGASGQKQGALIEVNCESDFVAKTDDFRRLARDLAMHVVGRGPRYVRREDVPAAVVARETAVFREQVKDKPENIQERIVAGKLDAYFAEICLLEQPFVRDLTNKKTVNQVITDAIAKLGENITVNRFARFEVGEEVPSVEASSALTEDGVSAPSPN